MSRTASGGKLESRTARLKLRPRKPPYWGPTSRPEISVGYRRISNQNGTWVARTYQGKPGQYLARSYAQADDYADSDGTEVLTYFEAVQRIAGEAPPVRSSSQYSMSQCVEDYLGFIEQQRRSLKDARSRMKVYVQPYFGDRPVTSLKPADFTKWLTWAHGLQPRGAAKTTAPAAELERRRRSTLNKVIAYLLAALNRAFQEGHVASREAWGRLRKFKGADSARIARLTTGEAKRLCNAAAPDFRRLLQVALITGCRYGELCAFKARDFDEGSGTLLVAQSKSGKSRRVPLTDEGQKLLASLCAGLDPDAHILTHADGSPWRPDQQFKPMKRACTAAKVAQTNFHALRHTTASLLAEEGTPLTMIAELLGHSDARMVSKHYQHLAPSIVADTIRAKLPSFGVRVGKKVRSLRQP